MTASAGPVLKRLHRQFGRQVAFVTLYVREAHPGERCPQPETFREKLEHARAYQARDQIPWIVAVDDVEGSLHQALDRKPNGAYLVDRDGRVAFRSLWSNDERALRGGLQAFLAGARPCQPEREPMLVPMLRGLGKMYDVLQLSGSQAKRDLLLAVPPVYLLARLAAWFRPLPPLARGAAASGTGLLGLAALLGLGWLVYRRMR